MTTWSIFRRNNLRKRVRQRRMKHEQKTLILQQAFLVTAMEIYLKSVARRMAKKKEKKFRKEHFQAVKDAALDRLTA